MQVTAGGCRAGHSFLRPGGLLRYCDPDQSIFIISLLTNVLYKRVCNISECAISDATRRLSFQHHFSSPPKMPSPTNERRVILALQALQNDKSLSVLAAAKAYNVNRMTLTLRRASRPARRDATPKSKKLTQSEEEAIVQYVLELDARSFPPRLPAAARTGCSRGRSPGKDTASDRPASLRGAGP